MFGAGGGTSSYEEVEETDLIFLWGSNARETHPIFFHHVLKAVHKGARLYVVDPRRTGSAQWADGWFGIDVGTDIALSNTMAREIIHAGLHNVEFIERATTGFDEYAASVEPWTLERGERETGVPADLIREAAHAYANADRAMICWTLGITEHHNAVDNVFCLINLGLLTGHVGRYGSGLNPLRGQNNVQGGGDMGAIPNKLPGFQDIESDHEARARFEQAWGVTIQPKYGWHLTQMFEAMERGDLKALYVVGENPAQSEADAVHTMHLLESARPHRRPGHLPDPHRRDRRRRAARLGELVRVRGNGHEQRAPRPARPPGARPAGPGARRHRDRLRARGAARPRLGSPDARSRSGTSCARCRRCTRGMSYQRLDAGRACSGRAGTRSTPASSSCTPGCGTSRSPARAAPFNVVVHELPVDELSDEFPIRLTTGRRLDSYNTGVQSGGYSSPLRRGESLDLSPEDCERLGVAEGEQVRITSRRGSVVAPVRVDDTLRPGLAFMTLHFPDEVETNVLTIDATDPKSGTAEFKATAIRVEKLPAGSREVSAAGAPGH